MSHKNETFDVARLAEGFAGTSKVNHPWLEEQDKLQRQLTTLVLSQVSAERSSALVIFTTLYRMAGSSPAKGRGMETLAVGIPKGSSSPVLFWNPDFVRVNSPETLMFGLVHEMAHLWLNHLHMGEEWNSGDPVRQVAQECVCNAFTWQVLKDVDLNSQLQEYFGRPYITPEGEPKLPVLLSWNAADQKTEESSPVDPWKWFEKVKAANPTVTFQQFVEDTETCYSYLMSLPEDQRPQDGMSQLLQVCSHGHENGGAGESDGNKHGSQDVMRRVIHGLYQRAINGDASAKKVLEEMGQLDPKNPLWGHYNLGALRGDTNTGRANDLWLLHTQHLAASLLASSDTLIYPRSMIGASPFFKAMGGSLPLMPYGETHQKKIAIFVDASGSMYGEVITKLAQMVGKFKDAQAHWWAFDTELYPFKPGDPIRGGGGTSFIPIFEHLTDTDGKEAYDAVLIVTDGGVSEGDKEAVLRLPNTLTSKFVWLTITEWASWVREPMYAHKQWAAVNIEAALGLKDY